MRVHAGAVNAIEGLRHEGRVELMALRDSFQGGPEGDRVVGGPESLVVLKVNLVLPVGHFVVTGLNGNAHGFQCVDHLLADIRGEVDSQVKVAGPIVWKWLDMQRFIGSEQEKLQLRPGLEQVTES